MVSLFICIYNNNNNILQLYTFLDKTDTQFHCSLDAILPVLTESPIMSPNVKLPALTPSSMTPHLMTPSTMESSAVSPSREVGTNKNKDGKENDN